MNLRSDKQTVNKYQIIRSKAISRIVRLNGLLCLSGEDHIWIDYQNDCSIV